MTSNLLLTASDNYLLRPDSAICARSCPTRRYKFQHKLLYTILTLTNQPNPTDAWFHNR